jgi:hypothetical protein
VQLTRRTAPPPHGGSPGPDVITTSIKTQDSPHEPPDRGSFASPRILCTTVSGRRSTGVADREVDQPLAGLQPQNSTSVLPAALQHVGFCRLLGDVARQLALCNSELRAHFLGLPPTVPLLVHGHVAKSAQTALPRLRAVTRRRSSSFSFVILATWLPSLDRYVNLGVRILLHR